MSRFFPVFSPKMPRWFVAACTAGLGGLLVLMWAVPAQAHAVLVQTTPTAGSILSSSPEHVSLRFSERISLASKQITVLAPDGSQVQRGSAERVDSGQGYSQPLRANLDRGTYVVSYRVISADGHPVGGGFSFSVLEPSVPAAAPNASAQAPVRPEVRGAVWVSHFGGYVGATLLAGAFVMALALWPRRLSVRLLAPLAVTGWVLIVVSSVLSLFAEVPYAYGGSFAEIRLGELADVLDSQVGLAYLTRIGLLCLIAPLLWRLLIRPVQQPASLARAGRPARLVAAGILLVVTFTWPLAGHAASGSAWQLGIAADAVHVAAAALWLGGLVVLVAVLLSRTSRGELAAILPAWSRWAGYAVAAIATTGVVQALLRLHQPSDLIDDGYGRLVLLKSCGLLVIMGVALISRRAVRCGLAADGAAGTAALRRGVAVEIAIAAAVLVAATVLTTTAPPQGSAHGQPQASLPYSTTVDSGGLKLQIDVDPARQGNNSVHLTAFSPSGAPVEVKEWSATAALASKNIAPISIALLTISPSHVVGEIELPLTGLWELRVTLRTSDTDQMTIARKIAIAQ